LAQSVKIIGLKNRDEIRSANFALISSRRMSIRASTMFILLVAIVMTTRLAGGLFYPYKGILPACARKAHW